MIDSMSTVPLPVPATQPGQSRGGAIGKAQEAPDFLAALQSCAADHAGMAGATLAATRFEVVASPPEGPVPEASSGDTASAVHDVDGWQQLMSIGIELHVRDAHGVQEIVAMPWRLVASGHLAQLSGVTQGAVSSARDVDAHVARAQPAMSGMMPAPSTRTAPSSSHEAGGSSMPVQAAPVNDRARMQDVGQVVRSHAPHGPAAIEWVLRWMKWIERDGHDTVVFLRDFRIDDEQAARMADGLRLFAEEQGISLERVVVNGRERWRSPHLSLSRNIEE